MLATGSHITIAVRSFTSRGICTAFASNSSWGSLHNSSNEEVNDLQGCKKKRKRQRERISAFFGVEEFLPHRGLLAVTCWFLVSPYWRGFLSALDFAQVWCHSTLDTGSWRIVTNVKRSYLACIEYEVCCPVTHPKQKPFSMIPPPKSCFATCLSNRSLAS